MQEGTVRDVSHRERLGAWSEMGKGRKPNRDMECREVIE